jgi:hypothetical protein
MTGREYVGPIRFSGPSQRRYQWKATGEWIGRRQLAARLRACDAWRQSINEPLWHHSWGMALKPQFQTWRRAVRVVNHVRISRG